MISHDWQGSDISGVKQLSPIGLDDPQTIFKINFSHICSVGADANILAKRPQRSLKELCVVVPLLQLSLLTVAFVEPLLLNYLTDSVIRTVTIYQFLCIITTIMSVSKLVCLITHTSRIYLSSLNVSSLNIAWLIIRFFIHISECLDLINWFDSEFAFVHACSLVSAFLNYSRSFVLLSKSLHRCGLIIKGYQGDW